MVKFKEPCLGYNHSVGSKPNLNRFETSTRKKTIYLKLYFN